MCYLSLASFSVAINYEHPKESVDSTTQKIYGKVTRPIFSPHTKEKWSGHVRLCYVLPLGYKLKPTSNKNFGILMDNVSQSQFY